MYEELIKSLRLCREILHEDDSCIEFVGGSCEAFPICAYQLMEKAADALEEMQRCLDGIEADNESLCKRISELEQRMPKTPHGRLIDADALIDDLKRQCKEVFRIDAVSPEDFWINRYEAYRERLYESWCEGFYEYVGSRPTITPAEEDE